MTRRLYPSLLVLALLGQTAVSLYACTRGAASLFGASAADDPIPRRGHPGHGGAGHDRGEADLAAAKGDHDGRAQAGPGDRHCNRHHREACPHAGAALHPCTTDAAAALQVTDAGLPSLSRTLVLIPGPDLPAPELRPTAFLAPPLSPEPPPPRTL